MLQAWFVRTSLKLHPARLKQQAFRFLALSVLILLPLILINLQLGYRGIHPALPSFLIEAGQPVPGNGDLPDDDL